MQRQGDKISDFGTYSTAETAQTKKPGTHVFDNSDVLRVSLSHHNYREWVVETKGIETGCPPHSHRTGLETESGTEIFDAEIERRNRPICRVSVNGDRAMAIRRHANSTRKPMKPAARLLQGQADLWRNPRDAQGMGAKFSNMLPARMSVVAGGTIAPKFAIARCARVLHDAQPW